MTMNTPSRESAHGVKLPVWRQIRWQLILAFVVLAVMPVVVVATITNRLTRDQLVTQAFRQLDSIAQLKQDQITSWIGDSSAGLRLLLSSDVHDDMVALIQTAPPSGTLQARVNAVLAEAINQGATTGRNSIRFRSLFLYTPEGLVIAASDPGFLYRVVTRQPYFSPSLQAEHVQPPYYEVGSTELVMVITQPLQTADGRTVGVLGAQLDLAVLGRLMGSQSGLGATGETYLVSQESSYLLTPSRVEGYPLTRAYHSEGIDAALRGQVGKGRYNSYRDPPVPVLGVYHWVPELRAGLLAEMAEAEALASADQLQQLSSGVMVGAILVAMFTGLLVATRIANPIALLTHMAARIEAGVLDQRVSLRQRNEVGVLAAGFNSMAARLQQTLQGLEERVAERTVALQEALASLETRTATQTRLLADLEQQRVVIRELSVPVIPISTTTLIMPLVGALDTARLDLLQSQALGALERSVARRLILDITGVSVVDTQVARGLLQVVEAARLLGSKVVIVGIRPEVAQTMVGLGIDMGAVSTFADLQSALANADRSEQQGSARVR
jgi:anti-anti-sigma regulatory factor/HAMP domain-containing protein